MARKASDDSPKPNEMNVEEPKVVEEKSEKEETPKEVNKDAPKVNETPLIPLSQIKIPSFLQKLLKKEDKVDLGAPVPTTMRLLMANRSIKKHVGVLYNVLVKVNRFIFLIDFVILDCTVDLEVPIIIGRTFFTIKSMLADVEYGEIKVLVNNKEVSFNVCKSIKQSMDLQVISLIDVIDDEVVNSIIMDLVNDPLVGVLCNFGSEDIQEYDEVIVSLTVLGSYTKNPANWILT
ncbi:uncharacterized protein LOC124898066 [Capsicum annuum]|uniref:uncharacterized protein LOC124898066 n=1 Tax=Capsicum annuum TaxID=4072 RepID=UPI001FB106BC|nr:uncharacterized protein LOC124898066 [Capsicum annuum]